MMKNRASCLVPRASRRIAVCSFDTNSWFGTMTAAAGTNAYTYTSSPTAGTVYVKVPRGLMLLVR